MKSSTLSSYFSYKTGSVWAAIKANSGKGMMYLLYHAQRKSTGNVRNYVALVATAPLSLKEYYGGKNDERGELFLTDI